FQMNISAEELFVAKQFGHPYHLLHRVIGILDNTGAQEQALDIIALVELSCEENDLFGSKPGTGRVTRDSIYTIAAIVDAVVGQQDLQKGNAASVGSKAVADSNTVGIAETTFDPGAVRPATGT